MSKRNYQARNYRVIDKRSDIDKKISGYLSAFSYNCDFNYHKNDNGDATNITLVKFNWPFYLKSAYCNEYIKTIKDYCIFRLLCGVNKDDIISHIIRGYYGDEVYPEYTGKVFEHIKAIDALDDQEAIEYILTQEYGYLLESIKQRPWHLVEGVSTEIINMPDNNLYSRLNRNRVDEYKSLFTGDNAVQPTCLCKTIYNAGYRLIDGRHRYIAAKELDLKMTVVYCESNPMDMINK